MATLTIADAARRCGVARRTLQRAIRSGRLVLTPDHRLTLAALHEAGYVPATTPQRQLTETPQRQEPPALVTPQDTPQATTHAVSQALEPIVARLDQLIARLDALYHTLAVSHAAAASPRQTTATPQSDPTGEHGKDTATTPQVGTADTRPPR
jgi:hypothetical protein